MVDSAPPRRVTKTLLDVTRSRTLDELHPDELRKLRSTPFLTLLAMRAINVDRDLLVSLSAHCPWAEYKKNGDGSASANGVVRGWVMSGDAYR